VPTFAIVPGLDVFEDRHLSVSTTYLKGIGDATPPFYVSTTPHEDAAKMSSFDPYVAASLPATSFQVGSARIGTTTPVPVTLTFSNKPSRTQVTLTVRKNGSSYQIYDIHYGSIPFYYAGPITDLLQFLSKYALASAQNREPGIKWISALTRYRGFDLQRTGYNPAESTVNASKVSTLQTVSTFNVGSNVVHEQSDDSAAALHAKRQGARVEIGPAVDIFEGAWADLAAIG
jgi:hypothetical protein